MLPEITYKNEPQIRAKLEDALGKIEDDLGISLKLSSPNLKATAMNYTLTVSNGEIDVKDTPSGHMFTMLAPGYGLKEDDLDKFFKHQNTVYRIVGWNERSRKYKVVCERASNGDQVRFPPEYVKSLLA